MAQIPKAPTLAEARAGFAEQRSAFDEILNRAIGIDQRISEAPTDALFTGAVLFTKALAHSIALDKRSPRLDAARRGTSALRRSLERGVDESDCRDLHYLSVLRHRTRL